MRQSEFAFLCLAVRFSGGKLTRSSQLFLDYNRQPEFKSELSMWQSLQRHVCGSTEHQWQVKQVL